MFPGKLPLGQVCSLLGVSWFDGARAYSPLALIGSHRYSKELAGNLRNAFKPARNLKQERTGNRASLAVLLEELNQHYGFSV